MADEAFTENDQCEPGVLNPDAHDQWFWGQVEPAAPASSPATTSSPPSWWQRQRPTTWSTRRSGASSTCSDPLAPTWWLPDGDH